MNKAQEMKMVSVSKLKPHPKNKEIYGKKQDVADLVQSFKDFKKIEPLKVTRGMVIISGHRRWMAAKQVGFKEVPAIFVDGLKSEEDQLVRLLLSNQQRNKTNEQRVREGVAWFDIESPKSEARSKRGKKTGTDPMETLPGGRDNAVGPTRDVVAGRVGMGSGRNFDKGKKAVWLIDLLTMRKKLMAAEGVRRELNQSFAAGLKIVKRHKGAPAETIALLELIGSGKAKDYNDAFGKKLRLEANRIPKNLPSATRRYDLHHGDILEVGKRIRKSLSSARNLIIVVDIPYVSKPYGAGTGDTWEGAIRKVAGFASKYLPTHGSLLVMTGQYWLPGVFETLCAEQELSYYWTYCVDMPGQSQRQPKRNISVQWKPILHFVKGPASDGNGSSIKTKIISDLIRSEPVAKGERLHEWQQPKKPFELLIDALTKRGDTVCDPMMGSGTIGVVAIEMKRKFIGIDIDKQMIRIAQKRLLETAKLLEATEQRTRRRGGPRRSKESKRSANSPSKRSSAKRKAT